MPIVRSSSKPWARLGAVGHRLCLIRPILSTEVLAALAALVLTLFYNQRFWHALADYVQATHAPGWLLGLACAMLVWGLHTLLFLLLLTRRTAKPLLALVFVGSALAAHFSDTYGIVIDPPMIRNVLQTDTAEAGEWLTPGLWLTVLVYAGLPILLLLRVQLIDRPWRVAWWRRGLAVTLVSLCLVTVGMLGFSQLAVLMREQKTLRYLVTPGNWLISILRVAMNDARRASAEHIGVALDAHRAPDPGGKPRLLIIVVGETVRAANWGLSGYVRDTTPELRRLGVLNFDDVQSCGTSTEVSLPCMFSERGRRHYDRDAILRSDSLLHVLDRAGVATWWRDNQTGCKGVCDGLPFESLRAASFPDLCHDGTCLDEILLQDLQPVVDQTRGSQVIVLHMLGNHGPGYASRYPPQFERYQPACHTAQLSDCSRVEIVNAYDNAILYTDHVLASTIEFLRRQQDRDTALIYLSDHGESLGEHGLYLHGMPNALAPVEQTQVPLVVWLSSGLQVAAGISTQCLKERQEQPLSHDNLFSSVLSLMDVETIQRDPHLDLFAPCRGPNSAELATNGAAPTPADSILPVRAGPSVPHADALLTPHHGPVTTLTEQPDS